MSRKLKVLFLGDFITDIQYTGTFLGPNRDGHSSFTFVDLDHKISDGGLGYCQNLLSSLIDIDMKSIRLSERIISRHVLYDTSQVAFQNETPATVINNLYLKKEMHDLLSWKPDIIYCWIDNSIQAKNCYDFSERMNIVEDLLSIMRTSLFNQQQFPVIIDDGLDFSYDIHFWLERIPIINKVHYQSKYVIHHNHYSIQSELILSEPAKITLQTSAQRTALTYTSAAYKKIISKEFENPKAIVKDTCGAGDTLLASFIASLERKNILKELKDTLVTNDSLSIQQVLYPEIKESLHIAQAAAHLTVQHSGTYIPTWKEIENNYNNVKDQIKEI